MVPANVDEPKLCVSRHSQQDGFRPRKKYGPNNTIIKGTGYKYWHFFKIKWFDNVKKVYKPQSIIRDELFVRITNMPKCH